MTAWKKKSKKKNFWSIESSLTWKLSLLFSFSFSVHLQVRDIEFQSSEAPTVKTQSNWDPAPRPRLGIHIITSQYLDIKKKS